MVARGNAPWTSNFTSQGFSFSRAISKGPFQLSSTQTACDNYQVINLGMCRAQVHKVSMECECLVGVKSEFPQPLLISCQILTLSLTHMPDQTFSKLSTLIRI